MKDGGQRQATTFALVTSALALGGLLFFLADPASSGLFWRCPFHALTGLYCPGCGTQRAVHALLHGQLKDALFLNALAVLVVLPIALWAYVSFAFETLGGKGVPALHLSGRWLTILLAVAVLFGVLRNLPVLPFTWFAP